jgi:hypothetical protein
MPSETERSYFRLALTASVHSQRFGLSDYTITRLSDEQVFDIGRDLVRLYEERFEAEIKKAPPAKPEAPYGSFGGARTRHRLRDQ